MSIKAYKGAQACSDFRLAKIQAELGVQIGDLVSINARYIHLAEFNSAIEVRQESILVKLLEYGEPAADTDTACVFWVMPRLGTISPWSTKATDIAHHCKLDALVRLERGVEWQIQLAAPRELSEPEKQQLLLFRYYS